MKRIIFLLCVAIAASGLAAQEVKISPTQPVVDYLTSLGADPVAIELMSPNAPSEALFLASGAPSKETAATLLAIVNKAPLETTDPEYIALGYDPHARLNDVVFSELMKFLPKDELDYTTYSMQIGDVVWSVAHSVPEDE
jgi:hypothetical protein